MSEGCDPESLEYVGDLCQCQLDPFLPRDMQWRHKLRLSGAWCVSEVQFRLTRQKCKFTRLLYWECSKELNQLRHDMVSLRIHCFCPVFFCVDFILRLFLAAAKTVTSSPRLCCFTAPEISERQALSFATALASPGKIFNWLIFCPMHIPGPITWPARYRALTSFDLSHVLPSLSSAGRSHCLRMKEMLSSKENRWSVAKKNKDAYYRSKNKYWRPLYTTNFNLFLKGKFLI